MGESQLLLIKITLYILGTCPGESRLFKGKKTLNVFKDGFLKAMGDSGGSVWFLLKAPQG